MSTAGDGVPAATVRAQARLPLPLNVRHQDPVIGTALISYDSEVEQSN
jgi:hypothetical protein